MWIRKPGSRKLTGLLPAVGLAAAYFLMPSAAEPQGRPAPQPVVGFGSSSDTSSLVVVVQAANRTPLAVPAQIIIYAENHQRYTEISSTNGNNRFDRIPLGNYTVEVSAEGYLQESEPVDVMMPNQQQQITISLRSLRDPVGKAVVAQPPLLAPKAQKELQKGLAELRAGRDDEARKHLLNALRLAPANPDVNYLLGVLAAKSGDNSAATQYWEKGLSQFPNHVYCLLALGGARYTQNDLKGAKDYLSRATTADSSLWRAYELLARIDLQIGEYPEAQREAEQAVRLGKEQAREARILLAKALILQNKRDDAVTVLQPLLSTEPPDAAAASAKQLVTAIAAAKTANASRKISEPSAAHSGSLEKAPSLAPPLPPPLKWIPDDVDHAVPPVEAGVACHLDEILPAVEKKVVRFAHLLDRFTATEHLEDQRINDQGIASAAASRNFNYLVSMREIAPGVLDVQEYRNGSDSLAIFPDGIATNGLPSVILMFHPVNRDEYEMQCEGLGAARGIPSWQIHFRQKETGQARLRTYRVGGMVYTAPLKGRAWISRDSFQVVRIETDLVGQIPQIKLFGEHQQIDYGPVRFPSRHTELWLPAITDYYTDFRGKRIHRRLTYTDYALFSVDDSQVISKPPPAKDEL